MKRKNISLAILSLFILSFFYLVNSKNQSEDKKPYVFCDECCQY